MYLKTDTHMTDFAMIKVISYLVQDITGEEQDKHTANLLGRLLEERRVIGDLGSKLISKPSAIVSYLIPDWEMREFHNNLSGGNNGITDLYFSRNAIYKKRVLWFGDSFGRAGARILSYFFSEVMFLRTGFFYPDIYDQIKPDILITENVERYLDVSVSDDDRPSYFMLPYLSKAGYQPSYEFAESFSAELSFPRRPYAHFVASLFKAERGLSATPVA